MRRLVAVALLAACSDGDGAAPDATPIDAVPIDASTEWTGPYEFWAGVSAPDHPDIRIDGEPRFELTLHLDGEPAPQSRTVLVENVVGGVVASSWAIDVGCYSPYPGCGEDYAYSDFHVMLCAFESGELRWDWTTCHFSYGACYGDGFCFDRCTRYPCPSSLRCGLDRVDGDPGHGWKDCVAIGPRALGESCTIDAGGIDDCGVGLYCVDGTCRAACHLNIPGCDAPWSCTQLEGMSPGVLACLPPAATSTP